MTEEELLMKISELEGRIASLEMRDDYTPAAESPVMEVPAPEKVDAEPFLFKTRVFESTGGAKHVFVYLGQPDSSPAVTMNHARVDIEAGDSNGWLDLGALPASGAWYVVLSCGRTAWQGQNVNPKSWEAKIALLTSVSEPGIYSDTNLFPSSWIQTTETSQVGLALFRAAERQWRVVAYMDSYGAFHQLAMGTQSFGRVAADVDVSTARGTGSQSYPPGHTSYYNGRGQQTIKWVNGALTLDFWEQTKSVNDSTVIPIGVYWDGDYWRLCRLYTEDLTFQDKDGVSHTIKCHDVG